MKTRQLNYLFFCNSVIMLIGIGLLPLLPLYALEFGATHSAVGFYLAFTYASITAGSILTNWLSRRLTHKWTFLGAGALGVPALFFLGQAAAFWQVTILTGLIWFCGGIGLALVSVFTGLNAGNNSRGRSFSVMSLARPLAAIVGGMTVGNLVSWQGYPLTFALLGAAWAGWPLVGLWILKNEGMGTPISTTKSTESASLPLGDAFYQLLLVTLLSTMTLYVGRLGTSLSMETLSFSTGAISSTTAVGGLVTMPVTFSIGTLSDRLGRRLFLILGYALASSGVLTLMAATQLWHFWLTTVFILVAQSTNSVVASAFATDLLPPETLSRALPWLNAMAWIAGILGFASTGHLMDTLGPATLYGIAAVLSLVTIVLLTLLPKQRQQARVLRPRLRLNNIRWPGQRQALDC